MSQPKAVQIIECPHNDNLQNRIYIRCYGCGELTATFVCTQCFAEESINFIGKLENLKVYCKDCWRIESCAPEV